MRSLAFTVALLFALPAAAIEYRSFAENAVLYDAPSTSAAKRHIIAKGTPAERVLDQGAWTKVRDAEGNMAWVETRLLAPLRTVIVRVDKADIRATADDKSAVVFATEKGVVLELAGTAPPGWAKVRHRDGESGFIRAAQIWGL